MQSVKMDSNKLEFIKSIAKILMNISLNWKKKQFKTGVNASVKMPSAGVNKQPVCKENDRETEFSRILYGKEIVDLFSHIIIYKFIDG